MEVNFARIKLCLRFLLWLSGPENFPKWKVTHMMLASVELRSYCTWRFIPVSRGRPPRQLTETAVRPSLSRLSTIRADFTEVVGPWAKIIELFTAGFAQGLHFVPVTRGRV